MPDETTHLLKRVHELERERRKCNCSATVSRLDADLLKLRARLAALERECNNLFVI